MIHPMIYAGLATSTNTRSRGQIKRHRTVSLNETKDIIKAVKSVTGVDMWEIKSKRRDEHTVDARHLLNFFLRTKTSRTLSACGKITNREGASVVHSVKVVRNHKYYEPFVRKINHLLSGNKIKQIDYLPIIKNAITEITGVSYEDIMSKCASEMCCDARHLFMFFCYSRMTISKIGIARLMNRGKGSVSMGIKKIYDLNEYDPVIKVQMVQINTFIDEAVKRN